MVAYSMELRTRVLEDSDAGLSSRVVAAKYAVSRGWVNRVRRRRRETGEVTPRRQARFRRRAMNAQQESRLIGLVVARPEATLEELREALPTDVALSTLWRALHRLGLADRNARQRPSRASNGRCHGDVPIQGAGPGACLSADTCDAANLHRATIGATTQLSGE